MTLKKNIHNFLKHPISNVIVVAWIPITLFCLIFYSFLITSLSNQITEEINNNLAKFKLGIVALFIVSVVNLLHLFFYHMDKVKKNQSLSLCIVAEIIIISTLIYRIQKLSYNSNNNEIEESSKINVYLILAFITVKLFGLSLMKKIKAISFFQSDSN